MNASRVLRTGTAILCIAIAAALCLCTGSAQADALGGNTVRVLIVDGFSNHDWRETTRLTKQILLTSGICLVDISTSPQSKDSTNWETWQPRFSAYDVIIQNCNSLGGRPTWPEKVQRDLETFVSMGGGLLILHSGNNAFAEWKEYNRMIGLGWRSKEFGWAIAINPDGTIERIPPGQGDSTGHGKRLDALLTRLGDHPIHKDLPRQWRAADLEVYRYARGPAEHLTVLSYAHEPQSGLNFPVEWAVKYGEGRVYNSTYGHVWKGSANPPGMRCVAFQTILVRAVQWLADRDVTWPVPADFPDGDRIQLRDEDTSG